MTTPDITPPKMSLDIFMDQATGLLQPFRWHWRHNHADKPATFQDWWQCLTIYALAVHSPHNTTPTPNDKEPAV